MKNIVIVGGGASGISAALSAARRAPKDTRITLLEGLDRVGKKILATGNGRCNLTNEEITPEHYHSGRPELLAPLLAEMPPQRTLEFFRSLGLYCSAEEMGRVYPHARQASAVLDTLTLALEGAGIQTVCSAKIKHIARKGGAFLLTAQDGRTVRADALILAAGGRAAPAQGTDGSGLALARQMGLECTPIYPCLVALKCGGGAAKGLKGIRSRGQVRLLRRGKTAGVESGEIQFTDYGLSGIPVFQLSCLLGPDPAGAELAVDLLPEWDQAELARWISAQARRYPSAPLERFLPGLVHKRLLFAVMKSVGISPLSRPASSLSPRETAALAGALKDWRFPVEGPLSWEQAQVTGGGISLAELDGRFGARRCPGLFLCGELLDVAGACGGYNLHWAWCSGLTAGAAAANWVQRG